MGIVGCEDGGLPGSLQRNDLAAPFARGDLLTGNELVERRVVDVPAAGRDQMEVIVSSVGHGHSCALALASEDFNDADVNLSDTIGGFLHTT